MKRCSSHFFFFGEMVDIDAESPNDDWSYRYASALKVAGVNSGILKMLPWERLLFKVGAVPGAPQWNKIPNSELEHIAEARDFVLETLGTDAMTLRQMTELLCDRQRVKAIKTLDKTFALDLQFLTHHAEPLLKKLFATWCWLRCHASPTPKLRRKRRRDVTLNIHIVSAKHATFGLRFLVWLVRYLHVDARCTTLDFFLILAHNAQCVSPDTPRRS